jgi:hypothetical protein
LSTRFKNMIHVCISLRDVSAHGIGFQNERWHVKEISRD